ncbi:SAV_915 family protein [Streptacidiphilus pinicola]|uniref:SAV_915 family protein n=1 Tax=Streptacidiphilus pinicola TaxID=2219663 RepID=UPI001FB3B28F|nr:SAV_915 family protein [Streptacidiphilus pinicola]
MTVHLAGDDSEPVDHLPTGLLLVPVRSGPAGAVLRLFRSPLGERTAVGFSSRRQLAAVLGPEQTAVELAEPALRAMADALGVGRITVDPQLAAAPAAAAVAGSATAPVSVRVSAPVAAPRGTDGGRARRAARARGRGAESARSVAVGSGR